MPIRGNLAMTESFRHRSARLVALSRVALGATFLVATFIDPAQPSRSVSAAYLILTAFVIWSVFVAVTTWSDWWLDYTIASKAHLVDMGVFGALVFLTDGYTTPFYTFSVFLLLSAAIRWTWRETAATAAGVVSLFLIAGFAAAWLGAPFEPDRLLIRAVYLVVLALLLIWFGQVQRGTLRAAGLAAADKQLDAQRPPTEAALRLVHQTFGAKRSLIFWWDNEEPWVELAEWAPDGVKERRLAPTILSDVSIKDDDPPFLFDWKRRCALKRLGRGRLQKEDPAILIPSGIADIAAMRTGLVIRIRGAHHSGELLIDPDEPLSMDHLELAAEVGVELGRLFDRFSLLALASEVAVDRVKLGVAQDLHDSVLQVLSGASFRLEGLRNWVRAGHDPGPQIDSIQADLAKEQQNIRGYVSKLRNGEDSSEQVDLIASMRGLMLQLKQNWELGFSLTSRIPKLEVSSSAEYALRQIVREAASNAVRHGGATAVNCSLELEDEDLQITISDNGSGFALRGNFDESELREKGLTPWSIYERAKSLGGTVSLFSKPGGTKLSIHIPMRCA
jgi:signal transduction histidine kinase